MYADELEKEATSAQPNVPERPPTPEEHPNSPDQDRGYKHPPVTNIMLLGPSGSGKSSLFNLATGDQPQAISKGTGICTTQFRVSRVFHINGRAFRLIDSPGFHTAFLSDAEILKKIVVLLTKSRPGDYHRKPLRLSGILYMHSEGYDAGDERLKGTIESLRRLVGDPWLPLITIGVIGEPDPETIAQLQESTSPFHPLCSGGAKILPSTLEPAKVNEILLGFEPMAPSQPRLLQRVRQGYGGRLEGLNPFIDEITGSHRAESGKAERPRRITLEESETSRQQLQVTLEETEIEVKSLRSQLEQTQSEYASLRSELQLNDNTEQSKIVQSLQDLNRAIDDFGRSVAEYMVDNYRADGFNNEDPTTLHASDFIGLQRQFGHQVGKSSLAASFTGDGLAIEDCIDLALRSFLCQKLCNDVFDPFHPALAASVEPGFMAALYEEVRHQASPTVAAKWRASSFVALSKGNRLHKTIIEEQTESLVAGDIQRLLNNLFGQTTTVALTESQRNQLQDIVTVAWELNYALKGEVVTLGDFHPLCYEQGVSFDRKTMVEFESDKKRKPGDTVICTVRLGLTLSYSKGARANSNPQIICPATVVTPTLYR